MGGERAGEMDTITENQNNPLYWFIYISIAE